jgi:DNA-binding NarL/FixJ family response regulator
MPTCPENVRVIILSPEKLYRLAWRSLLRTQTPIGIVLAASCVAEVESLLRVMGRSTLLVDARGSERLTALKLELLYKVCRVLFVVDDYHLATIIPLIKNGAIGCVARNDSVSQLAQAIMASAKEEIALPADITSRVVAALAKDKWFSPPRMDELTDREMEILQLLTDGMTNKAIAQRLFLSVRTVEAHLRGVYSKLRVNTRTQAALWAVRNGCTSSS